MVGGVWVEWILADQELEGGAELLVGDAVRLVRVETLRAKGKGT